MEKHTAIAIAIKAAKIYFEQNISAKEAIKIAEEAVTSEINNRG